MSTGAIEASSAASGVTQSSQTGSSTSSTGLNMFASGSSADKDMFLQLLVAQLKYQDPMNPTDSSEFLSQSAQFTSLEKMQLVADQTAMLLGAQMAFGSSSLVGRNVGYTLEDGTEGSGVVHGVTFGDKGPVLDVDGVSVPIASVLSVTDTPEAPATTP